MERLKELSEMSLEELWQLFPIELVPHRPHWKEWAKEETAFLTAILKGHFTSITHIGSTAIPGIQAKPIIDILVEVPVSEDFDSISRKMQSSGYILMSSIPNRMSFNKGYTPAGYAERVFHIHIHRAGDNDEILFRDYLLSHPESAKAYESLKLSLLPRYRHNRDGYTAQKTEFVKAIVEKAKAIKE